MLVLPPPSPVSYGQIARAVAAILLTVLVVPLIWIVRHKLRIARAITPIPGPRGMPLLGMLPELMKNLPRIFHFQEELINRYAVGGRIKLPVTLFSDGLIYITDPADIKHVLATNFSNYVKSELFIASAGETFNKSLFGLNHAHCADNGAMFTLQRKVAGKVFTANNFRLFSEQVFHKYALKMVGIINLQQGQCDMNVVSGQYTMQAIFDIGCGVPLRDVDASLGLQFVDAMAFVVKNSVDRVFLQPYFRFFGWLMPSEYKRKKCEQLINTLAEGLLEKRLKESEAEIAPRSDIMSLFIKKARGLIDEGSSVLDVKTLRSIFLTFIIAGWDTTASSITYSFYELARHPKIQQKIVDELQELTSSGDVISYDDIKKLKYLDAVVSESMRLHPTVPANMKYAAEDDYLPDGTFIPAGVEIMYNSFYIGRNSPIWGKDPHVFRPERWLEMKTRPSAYDFPVFQAGPRICPGMNMALLETKLFIAVMLRHFEVRIREGVQVEDRGYIFSATLIMDGGLPLQMTPRSASAC
ncbi:hypothetical protein Gpo141_00011039 [Globisporangium polare]